MPEPEAVLLVGGPLDGVTMSMIWGPSLLASGPPVPDGLVARYRPTRERGVYRFREYDRVVARIGIAREDGAS